MASLLLADSLATELADE